MLTVQKLEFILKLFYKLGTMKMSINTNRHLTAGFNNIDNQNIAVLGI